MQLGSNDASLPVIYFQSGDTERAASQLVYVKQGSRSTAPQHIWSSRETALTPGEPQPRTQPQDAFRRRKQVWLLPEDCVLCRGGSVRGEEFPQVLLPVHGVQEEPGQHHGGGAHGRDLLQGLLRQEARAKRLRLRRGGRNSEHGHGGVPGHQTRRTSAPSPHQQPQRLQICAEVRGLGRVPSVWQSGLRRREGGGGQQCLAQELLPLCQMWQGAGVHHPGRQGRRNLLQRLLRQELWSQRLRVRPGRRSAGTRPVGGRLERRGLPEAYPVTCVTMP